MTLTPEFGISAHGTFFFYIWTIPNYYIIPRRDLQVRAKNLYSLKVKFFRIPATRGTLHKKDGLLFIFFVDKGFLACYNKITKKAILFSCFKEET